MWHGPPWICSQKRSHLHFICLICIPSGHISWGSEWRIISQRNYCSLSRIKQDTQSMSMSNPACPLSIFMNPLYLWVELLRLHGRTECQNEWRGKRRNNDLNQALILKTGPREEQVTAGFIGQLSPSCKSLSLMRQCRNRTEEGFRLQTVCWQRNGCKYKRWCDWP